VTVAGRVIALSDGTRLHGEVEGEVGDVFEAFAFDHHVE